MWIIISKLKLKQTVRPSDVDSILGALLRVSQLQSLHWGGEAGSLSIDSGSGARLLISAMENICLEILLNESLQFVNIYPYR